jgi:hypothetical protein
LWGRGRHHTGDGGGRSLGVGVKFALSSVHKKRKPLKTGGWWLHLLFYIKIIKKITRGNFMLYLLKVEVDLDVLSYRDNG